MKSIIFIICLLFFSKVNGQERIGHSDFSTVFDSLIKEKTGLTCQAYYNKVLSKYYQQNSFKGFRDRASVFYADDELPAVFINGRYIMAWYNVFDLFFFKKLKTAKFIAKTEKTEIAKYFNGVVPCNLILFQTE